VAVVLDSSAIVAFLDRDDGLNDAATAALGGLATEQRLLASAVTFAELLTGAHLLHHDEALVRGFFADLIAEILPVEVATAERAAELRSGHRSLRMPDALILATADIHSEAHALLTGEAGFAAVAGIGCRVDLLSRPVDGG
jgi:predicted nucleic acid-binding protein